MANTVTLSGNFLTISGLDADWNLPGSSNMTDFQKQGLMVRSIRYNPGTDTGGDVMKIFNTSTGGAEIFNIETSSGKGEERIKYYGSALHGAQMFPYISSSGITISTGSTLTFELA